MSNQRFLTIFADASFCPETKAAGWGAWIKGAGPAVITGATFEGPVTSAPEAELCALARAVGLAFAQGMFADSDIVMLQSDCLYALSRLRGIGARDVPKKGGARVGFIKSKANANEADAVAKIKEAVGSRPLLVRHVKGHKSGDGRQWVNAECDRIAREGMKAGRKAAAQ